MNPTLPKTRPFAQVDVFASQPLKGNPVAVVLAAAGLTDAQMQDLARWTNLSETTFVLPATSEAADYRLRIFTPGGELPFAGHPTLGSAHAWLEAGNKPRNPEVLVQQCGAGLVSIRNGEVLSFQAPSTVKSGPLDEYYLTAIAAAFGIDISQIMDHQWVDNGPGWAVVRLASAEAVLALEPDFSFIPQSMLGVIGDYADDSPHAYELRAFAPKIGVAEDPVTGSINASVAQWLVGAGKAPRNYSVSQGLKLDRAGVITVSTDEAGAIWVGGATNTLVTGNISL